MTNPASAFPGNFHLLHTGEEQFRTQSIEAIEASPDMLAHTQVVEPAITLIRHYVLRDDHHDEDDLHVRLLCIRVANELMASLQALLSGYYQPATMIQRDLIETTFLLDHFSHDRKRITLWRTTDDKTREREFKPVKVREALDAHYQHAGQKRAAAYKLFSQLAGHPTPAAARLLRRSDGTHECGPFFELELMKATLEELAKLALQAGETANILFSRSTYDDYAIQFAFYEPKVRWMERFYGVAVDENELRGLRAAIDRQRGPP